MNEALRMVDGSQFHVAGPAIVNACLANFVLIYWIARSLRADDRVQTLTHSDSSDRYRCQLIHHFVHRQTQFETDVLWYRHWHPMQTITNRTGYVRVFSCTAKHPRSSVHHTLQTIDSILRDSSEKDVTIINSANYRAVDYSFCRIEWKCLNGIPDPSELVITVADDMIYMWQKLSSTMGPLSLPDSWLTLLGW